MAYRIKSPREDAELQKYRAKKYYYLRSAIMLSWWPPRKTAQRRLEEWLDPNDILDNVNRILRKDSRLEMEISNVLVILYIDGELEMEVTVEDGHRFRPTNRGQKTVESVRRSMMSKVQ